MMPFRYSIDDAVFAWRPGYVRGVVIAQGLKNPPSPPELVSLLRGAEEEARATLDLETLAEHPRISSWREAYRAFGAKPSKFRPSMEAMLRRILRGDSIRSIGTLVDLGNVVSIRRLVPAGGHATDVLSGDISLRPARGDERFVAFGSDQEENPEPGEIVFVEGDVVLTRRWTWRQAQHTLLVEDTTAALFNVDGLPPVTVDDVTEACEEIARLLERFCGASTRIERLSIDAPRLEV